MSTTWIIVLIVVGYLAVWLGTSTLVLRYKPSGSGGDEIEVVSLSLMWPIWGSVLVLIGAVWVASRGVVWLSKRLP